MSVSLVSRNVARKLLLVQLLVVIASGLLFSLKDPFWGVSAISGGLAVFLPNVLFMIFAWRLAADRYVGFGAGGSDTGTGCN